VLARTGRAEAFSMSRIQNKKRFFFISSPVDNGLTISCSVDG
jgi:hypothetical protein